MDLDRQCRCGLPVSDRFESRKSADLRGQMKISVIGAGYVGLTTAACLAQIGHNVFCCESDTGKLDKLQKGIIPIFEPHLEQIASAGITSGNLRFGSTEEGISWANVLFICVGT